MGEKDDGKIRIRCTGCGKRVKFPKGEGGETFRCPVCGKTIVAPLNDDDATLPSEDELMEAARSAPAPAAPRHQISSAASAPSEQKEEVPERNLNALERLATFLARQNMSTAQQAREVLGDTSLGTEEIVGELRQLRHDKAVRLNKFFQAVLMDIEQEILSLRKHPAAETESIQNRLRPLEEEQRALTLYVKVMFELRTLPEPRTGSARPGARGGASARPSRPSTPAPQTPQRNPNGGPAPERKAPDSS